MTGVGESQRYLANVQSCPARPSGPWAALRPCRTKVGQWYAGHSTRTRVSAAVRLAVLRSGPDVARPLAWPFFGGLCAWVSGEPPKRLTDEAPEQTTEDAPQDDEPTPRDSRINERFPPAEKDTPSIFNERLHNTPPFRVRVLTTPRTFLLPPVGARQSGRPRPERSESGLLVFPKSRLTSGLRGHVLK
jgi:hypothetical protein